MRHCENPSVGVYLALHFLLEVEQSLVQPVHNTVSHVGLLRLVFDELQSPNLERRGGERPERTVHGQLAQLVVPQVAVSQQDTEQGEGHSALTPCALL
ncbi:hypothetical protein INR49_003816 [Caranx melampygus]|nr:hypothetical protein INR49_003816 [Caranx melampygus]